MFKSIWPWLAAIVTGALYTLCFAPFNQSWLCWFCLTPLIAAVWFSGQNSRRLWLRHLLIGYVAGIIFFTAAFSWLGSLGTLFENLFLHGLSFLLSLYMGLYFAVWAWFIGLLKPADFLSSLRNLATALVAACAWVALEWIRGWLFTGWGWNGLGVALHANWPIIQIAEFTGVGGLSFAVAFTNLILITTALRLYQEARTRKMHAHFDLTLTMIGLVGLFGFGIHRAQQPSTGHTVRVAAVQPNIQQRQKFDPQFAGKILDKIAHLSEIALRSNPALDLLIWPEATLPDPVRDENTASHRFVMDLSTSSKADLLLGTDDVNEGRPYNAAVLVSGSDQNIQAYRKIHLVPFGEYIPLRHSFPLFAMVANQWVPGDFDFGKDYTVFSLTNNPARIAPLICFEDTIGDLTRQFVLKGADLLVNVTNDGWFLDSAGSQQHLANCIFRCVETRRPMVRAANTGVTCFVNEFGRVTQILRDDNGSTFTEGVLAGEISVPTDPPLTFYTRHGELFAKLCGAASLAAIAFLALARRRA